MPGVSLDKLQRRPPVRTKAVQFSPAGRSWAAATTEGLLMFTLDESLSFDPFNLTADITPESIRAAVSAGNLLQALLMSLKLNEETLIREAFEAIGGLEIALVARELPQPYLPRLLRFLAGQAEAAPALEAHLLWALHLLSHHARHLRSNPADFGPALRGLRKQLGQQQELVGRAAADNLYTLRYLSQLAARPPAALVVGTEGAEQAVDATNPFAAASAELERERNTAVANEEEVELAGEEGAKRKKKKRRQSAPAAAAAELD